jgi:Flp pilus assembly protein TadB
MEAWKMRVAGDLGPEDRALTRRAISRSGEEQHAGHAVRPGGHAGHGWMMLICCVPMLVIALVLVATGVVSVGFLLVALACPAMMFLMMRGMQGGNH